MDRASDFRFVPIRPEDRTLMIGWLEQPHVKEWWGEPEHEWTLIEDGEASGESEGFIVHDADGPVAYVQSWVPGWDEAHYDIEPWQRDLTGGERGVDITLGEPRAMGRGYGHRIVAAFAERLFNAGTPRLTIDPDIRNIRAIRAYEKAGFRVFDTSYAASHSVLLMDKRPGTDER